MKIEIKKVYEYDLAKEMKEKGFSFRSLARKSGVDHTYIHRLNIGMHKASPEVALKLIEALDDTTYPSLPDYCFKNEVRTK